jgi:serine/threonine-protein kinase RsbW
MNDLTAVPLRDVRWEKAYSGLPATVTQVRGDVRAILGPCPEVVADDLELVVSELVANAIKHSRSGEPGGTYTVRISHQVTEKVPYIWVEVVDQGSSSWDGTFRPEATHGLAVIPSLSDWCETG